MLERIISLFKRTGTFFDLKEPGLTIPIKPPSFDSYAHAQWAMQEQARQSEIAYKYALSQLLSNHQTEEQPVMTEKTYDPEELI